MLADLSGDEVFDFSRTDCAIALASYTAKRSLSLWKRQEIQEVLRGVTRAGAPLPGPLAASAKSVRSWLVKKTQQAPFGRTNLFADEG